VSVSETRPPTPDQSSRGASSGNGVLAPLPETYYNRPLLKKPHWEWEVITYLFMGGVMGGAGIISALTDDETDPDLARSTRYLAFALASTCPVILIKHLGRPERFHHMLRIFKWRSPMSMGVWGLLAFSAPATLSAIGQAARDGLLPRWAGVLWLPRLLDPMMAILGAFMGGYTGVLLSATAIPVWGIGKRHIPAFSLCSGVAGACAVNSLILAFTGGSAKSIAKLERFELAASLAELALLAHFKSHAGAIGKPLFAGARGAKLTRITEVSGIVVPALLGLLPGHARWKTALASVLTLAGGYVLRETLIEGGKDSSEDPRAASRQPE
jgi:formate-dependent nitrite reductase membrane component NrfD